MRNLVYTDSSSTGDIQIPTKFINPYRYGFNGKEKDDEVKGAGNSYDFGSRIYDPRLGRWLSLDPEAKKFASFSSYCSFNNSPILIIDKNGKGGELGNIHKENGQYRADLVFTINLVVDEASGVSVDAVKAATADYINNPKTVGHGVINATIGTASDPVRIYTDVKIVINVITSEEAVEKVVSETNKSNNYVYVVKSDGATEGEKNFYGSNQGVISSGAVTSGKVSKYLLHYAWHSAGAKYGSDESDPYGVGTHNGSKEASPDEDNSIMNGGGKLETGELLYSDFDALSPIFEQENHTKYGSGVPIHFKIEKDEDGNIKNHQFGGGINNKPYTNEEAKQLYGSDHAEEDTKGDLKETEDEK